MAQFKSIAPRPHVPVATCQHCGYAKHETTFQRDRCPKCNVSGLWSGAADGPPVQKRTSTRVALKCNECGKRFRVHPSNIDAECPKCGGVDWEVE